MSNSTSGNRKRPNETTELTPDRNKRHAQSDVPKTEMSTDTHAEIASRSSEVVERVKTKDLAGKVEKKSDDMSEEERLVRHCDLDLSGTRLTCLTDPSLLMIKEVYIFARTLAVLNSRSPLFSINTTPQLGPPLSKSVQQRIGRSALMKDRVQPNNVCHIHIGRSGALGFDVNLYLICPKATSILKPPSGSRARLTTETLDERLEIWYDGYLLPVLQNDALEKQFGWRWDDWRQALANSMNGPGGRTYESQWGKYVQEQRVPPEVLGQIWEGVEERLFKNKEDDFLKGAFLCAYAKVADFDPSGSWTQFKERWDRCITLKNLYDYSEIESRLRLSFKND